MKPLQQEVGFDLVMVEPDPWGPAIVAGLAVLAALSAIWWDRRTRND